MCCRPSSSMTSCPLFMSSRSWYCANYCCCWSQLCSLKYSFGLQKLECSKPVIVAGDLNCARHSIDIHNPQVSVFAQPFIKNIYKSFGHATILFICSSSMTGYMCISALLDTVYVFNVFCFVLFFLLGEITLYFSTHFHILFYPSMKVLLSIVSWNFVLQLLWYPILSSNEKITYKIKHVSRFVRNQIEQ